MLSPRRSGFTTIELMIVLVVLAILATIALPAYQQQVRKLRRAEAITALAQIQQAQERRRSEQPAYSGTLGSGGLGLPGTTPGGHYQLDTDTPSGQEATAYSASATAQGRQGDDRPCTHLRLEVSAGQLAHRSGVSTAYGNDTESNRRCWNQ
jgi:type IV pilus assembly protein PilE